MPRKFKKHFKKQFKKHRRQKNTLAGFLPKSSNNKPSTMVLRSPSVVTDRLFTKLVYTQRITLAGDGTLPKLVQFAGNSIYDPDVKTTTFGHFPYGYKELSLFYNKYLVHSSRITVNIQNGSSSALAHVCIVPNGTPTNPISGFPENIRALPYAKYTALGLSTGNGKGKLSMYMSTKKVFGISHPLEAVTDFTGVFSSLLSGGGNPGREWTYDIIGSDMTDGGVTFSIYLDVKVEYYVELFNRRELMVPTAILDNGGATGSFTTTGATSDLGVSGFIRFEK